MMAYFTLESRSQQLQAEISSKYQGTAKIFLDHLYFDPEGETSREKSDRLVDIFKQEGCDRLNENHAISGNISPDLLSASLELSNLRDVDLSGPVPPVLHLPIGMQVRCFYGKHRVEALRQLKHASPWWTVKLYTDLSPNAIQLLAEDFTNEGQSSDGYIFVKISSYPLGSIDANKWWTRLSKSKPEILKRLLKHAELGPALERVLQIPGLRSGLQLAIWKKIMGENCTEEVLHYLNLVYDTWHHIMGSTAALEFVDADAVRELELRAPGISRCDDLYVSNAIWTNSIFRGVSDSFGREGILQRLQQVDYLIPTVHTLQQDFKYLRQCTSVMRQLILGQSRLPITVQSVASNAYRGSASSFLQNMKVLYLDIMQNLVELSGEGPLKEDHEKGPRTYSYHHGAWHRLAIRAEELGFFSGEISRLRHMNLDQEMAKRALLDARPKQHFDYGPNFDSLVSALVRSFNEARPIPSESTQLALTTSCIGEPIKRRCGRQYSKAYSNDRSYITLDNFLRKLEKDADITSLFVRRSVFHAFWGWRDEPASSHAGVSDQIRNERDIANDGATVEEDYQMSDMVNQGGGSEQDHQSSDQQMSDVGEGGQDITDDYEMVDRLAPTIVTSPDVLRPKSSTRILNKRWGKRISKSKKARKARRVNRSLAV